jgi:hypothetical protein
MLSFDGRRPARLRCRRTGAGDTLLVVRLDRLFIRPLVTVLVGLQRLFAPGEKPAEPESESSRSCTSQRPRALGTGTRSKMFSTAMTSGRTP